MKKLVKASIALSLLLGIAGCGNSESPKETNDIQSEPVQQELTSKDYNIVFINNDLLKAEWIYVEDNTYAIEITNQADQNLYVYDSDDPIINHDKKVNYMHSIELAPGQKEIFPYIVEDDIDCLSIELEASFYDGKDGDQDYIGAFCLLPKENEVIPFDGENCVHTKHKHNNPELFKNENITINFVTMTENYGRQSPVISITSNNHTPIDWSMFIIDITNDKGESTFVYGSTALYPFVDNGIRYVTLNNDIENWEGTWNVNANSTDGPINFSFEIDANGNVK